MADEDTNGSGLLSSIAGKAKEVVGNVVGDERLAREGSLQQEKVDAEKAAAQAEAVAEQREEAAAIDAAKRENELARQRVEVEATSAEREERLERERETAER